MNEEAQKLGEQIKRQLLDACINASHKTRGLIAAEVAFDAAVDRLVALAHREPVGEARLVKTVTESPCDILPGSTIRTTRYSASTAPTSASEPAAPSGEWQWVPKEPTDAMLDATYVGQHCSDIWRDMLAAAPHPSGEPAPADGFGMLVKRDEWQSLSPEAREKLIEMGKRVNATMRDYTAAQADGAASIRDTPLTSEPAPHHLMVGDVVRQCAYLDRGQYSITGMHGVNNCWITVAHPYGPFRANELERVPSDGPAPAARDLEIEHLRKALVYVAFGLHATQQHMLIKGISLIDGDTVRVSLDGWAVEATTNPHRRSAHQPAAQEQTAVQRDAKAMLDAAIDSTMNFRWTSDGMVRGGRYVTIDDLREAITSATPSAQQVPK